jgi:hypothetical protein
VTTTLTTLARALPLLLLLPPTACDPEPDGGEALELPIKPVSESGVPPSQYCTYICSLQTAGHCIDALEYNACLGSRCAEDAPPCEALLALLDCTVEWPRFDCDSTGHLRLAQHGPECQHLYDAYIAAPECQNPSAKP